MDDPDLDQVAHLRALAGLRRLNRLSGDAREVWPALSRWCTAGNYSAERPMRVLDLATGAGDLPLALAARAATRGMPMVLSGCDISGRAIGWAAERAGRGGGSHPPRPHPVEFFVHDALRPIPGPFDVVVCSLFMHHLSEDDARTVLGHMAAGAPRVAVLDLARSRFNLACVWAASRCVTRSAVVHTDATLSVRGAFTPGEFAQLAESAGLRGGRLTGAWPCRFLYTWERP